MKTWSEVLAIAEGRDRPPPEYRTRASKSFRLDREFVCRLRLCLGLQPYKQGRHRQRTNLERAEALWVQLSANQQAILRAKYMRPAALE